MIDEIRLQKHNLAKLKTIGAQKKKVRENQAQLRIQETQYYNSAVRFAKFSLP
jgi:hypothetical protein